MIYPIVAYGDPVLRKKAIDVDLNDKDLPKLIDDMFETMHNASGVGLAAPQIGLSKRIFIVEGGEMLKEEEPDADEFIKVFINAEILAEEGDEWEFEEGCLSIPDVHAKVMRAPTITIKYFDVAGKECTEKYDGIRARIIQHEYDHIEGVLFTDHMSGLKKRMLKGKLNNISKGKVSTKYRMRYPSK